MKKMIFAVALCTTMVSPVMAEDEALRLVFQADGQAMQLARLSPQEMEETQGALIPAIVVGAIAGGIGHLLTDNPTLGGFVVSAGTGAFAGFGFPGAMIAVFGGAAASQFGGGKNCNNCTIMLQ